MVLGPDWELLLAWPDFLELVSLSSCSLDIPGQLDPLMEQLQVGASRGAMRPYAEELKERIKRRELRWRVHRLHME